MVVILCSLILKPGWREKTFLRQQNANLRYNGLGACTELVKFFFNLLDPEMLAEYLSVSNKLSDLDVPLNFETRRRGEDPFTLKALLINSMTYEHKDKSDWIGGLA